ncbi:aromatic-ring-hydroxylating dioxygenase, beta subunit [Rhizorhabdus wittichii RW1]|uniref:Aromatic-ring-hydroxylating dioxygenase, beta subunit n=1 Tax=Rhizorhabdus wittichii (strain DSM 6014 / CCUG 31198 / JCM 15750 / NBRC 105917 / EY 4224 / RW1) TaxID=392499 RepID=A0A9J9HAY7_RHIWR|nr:aromatic-ring-hydroxylating dioxygenase, beta subunit [Rhizorhabdus wittichii RW1]
MIADPLLTHAAADYLFREAELLDGRRWEEWDALFAEDGMYWVPLRHDQQDPFNHASLFYEDAILRDVRRRRLEEKHAWSQQPVTRTAHIVGNVRIVAQDGAGLRVRSAFQITEWRQGRDQRQLAGHYTHDLVGAGPDDWRIALKRVDLINCDGIQDPYEVFL